MLLYCLKYVKQIILIYIIAVW